MRSPGPVSYPIRTSAHIRTQEGTTMPEFHLSMNGTAPSGESFDVTLYFDRDATWSLKHRIDALGKAAYEASRGVLLDDPRESVRPGEESGRGWGGDL